MKVDIVADMEVDALSTNCPLFPKEGYPEKRDELTKAYISESVIF